MPAIDPVILQLRVEDAQYRASSGQTASQIEKDRKREEVAAQKAANTIQKEAERAAAAAQRAAERESAAALRLETAKQAAAIRTAARKDAIDAQTAANAERTALREAAAAERAHQRATAAAETAAKRQIAAAARVAEANSRAALRQAAAADVAASREAARGLTSIRTASIGAGQQLQDMAVQFESGTRASTIMAQQLPQLAFALSSLEGSTNRAAATLGRVAVFLSGPWGAAIAIAGIALTPLITQMFNVGEAAEKMAEKSRRSIQRIRDYAYPQDPGVAVNREATAQANKLTDELIKKRQLLARLQNAPEQTVTRGINDSFIEKKRAERLKQLPAEIAELERKARELLPVVRKVASNLREEIEDRKDEPAKPKTPKISIEQKQNDLLADRILSLRQELELQQMIAAGNEQQAAMKAAQWEIEKQFPEADEKQLQLAKDLVRELISQKGLLDAIKASREESLKLASDFKMPGLDQGQIDGYISRFLDQNRVLLESVDTTAVEMEEALGRVRERAVENLTDGLTDAITGAESLGDAFSRVADQIIADLVRIAVKRAIIEPLGDALFGGEGGGFLSGIFSGIGSIFGGGKAAGGPVSAGTPYLVGERGQELFVPQQSGTIIPNHLMNQTLAPSTSGSESMVRVQLMLSDDIDGRIVAVSSGVAVEVVRGAAPGIVSAASNQTMGMISRRKL
jgi:hypothetical protein